MVNKMDNKTLKQACKILARESFEWMRLKKEAKAKGQRLSDEELQRLTSHGAWENYLNSGGSRSMINTQLEPSDDFGGQYHKMCVKAGYEKTK